MERERLGNGETRGFSEARMTWENKTWMWDGGTGGGAWGKGDKSGGIGEASDLGGMMRKLEGMSED